MSELFKVYADQGPHVVAGLFFLLGLVFGSFSSVLYYRIPLRLSFWAGRSCCPHCGQQLRLWDLVPLLSYAVLRGRCRDCVALIDWRYPLLEGICGLISGTAGFFLGWAGGFAALGVWVLTFVLLGLARRRTLVAERSGSSLVEVLVAGLLFVAVAAPTLGAIRAQRQAELLASRRTVMVGLAREAISRAEAAVQGQPPGIIKNHSWQVGIYTVNYNAVPADAAEKIWDVVATVSCAACTPAVAHQVKLSGVIIGVP